MKKQLIYLNTLIEITCFNKYDSINEDYKRTINCCEYNIIDNAFNNLLNLTLLNFDDCNLLTTNIFSKLTLNKKITFNKF